MILRLLLLWVPVVVPGPPLPRLGFAAAVPPLRRCAVAVAVVSALFPPGVGVVVVPLGDLGGLWACGLKRGLGMPRVRSRCGPVVVAWLALSPVQSG